MHSMMTPAIARQIIRDIGTAEGIAPSLLFSASRAGGTAQVRQLAYWCLAQLGAPLYLIGAVFDRDHATILHGIGRVEEARTHCPRYRAHADQLRDDLREGAHG